MQKEVLVAVFVLFCITLIVNAQSRSTRRTPRPVRSTQRSGGVTLIPPRTTQQRPSGTDPRCPVVNSGQVGICVQECGSGNPCPNQNETCCSNGCGQICIELPSGGCNVSQLIDDLMKHPQGHILLRLAGCDKIKEIMKLAENEGILEQKILLLMTGQQEVKTFLPFLSFLPEKTCQTLATNPIGSKVVQYMFWVYMYCYLRWGELIKSQILIYIVIMNNLHILKNMSFAGCGIDNMVGNNGTTSQGNQQSGSGRPPVSGQTMGSLDATISNKTRNCLMLRQPNSRQNCDFKCGKIIAKKMLQMFRASNNTVDASNVKQKLGMLGKCIGIDQLPHSPDTCKDIPVEYLEAAKQSRQQGDKIASECKPPNKNPQNYTKDDIIKRNCSFAFSRPSEYRNIRISTLCQAMDNLSHCLNISIASEQMKTYVKSKCTNSTKVQNATLGLASFAQLRNLNNKEKQEIAKQARRNGQKIKADALEFSSAKNADVKDLAKNPNSASTLPAKYFMNKIKNGKIKVSTFIQTAKGLDTSQRRALAKEYQAELKTTFDKLNEEQIKKMGPVAKGLRKKDIIAMCTSRAILCENILRNISDDSVNWKGKVADYLSTLLKDFLAAKAGSSSTSSRMKALTAAEVESMTMAAIRGLDMYDITNATAETAITICDKLSTDKRRPCLVNHKMRKRQATACMQVKGIDLSASGMISDVNLAQFVADLANMTDISSKLSSTFLKNGGPRAIAACPFCMHPKLAKKIIEKLQTIDYNTLNTLDFEKYGCWLLYLVKEGISGQSKSFLQQAIVNNSDIINKDMQCHKLKEVECSLNRINKTEISKLVTQGKLVLAQAAQAQSQSSSGRKKREAIQPYTCKTIMNMGSGVSSFLNSSTQVNAMDNKEFLDCISDLGKITDWTSEMHTALFQKTLTVLMASSACSLSPGDITSLGTIAYGIPSTDISCMPITADVIAYLGQLHMWSDGQRTALAKRYLQHNNKATAANLDDVDLVLMGHAICGLTSNEIGMILPAVYEIASKLIGSQLITSPPSCLAALANLAKLSSVYGSVSGWTASTYSDIGIVLAGLTGEELKTATEDSITGWTENGIKHIPASELKKLDASHFNMMSRQQSAQISESVRIQLTKAQQEALASAYAGFDGSDAEPVYLINPVTTTRNPLTLGASALTMSVSTLIILVMAALLTA